MIVTRPLTKDVRKAIPMGVKLAVALRHLGLAGQEIEFDHEPALSLRRWDDAAQDFDPPQLDPRFIVIRRKREHAEKTFGRKADAERTVTTRGSDVGEAARLMRIVRNEREHHMAMLRKTMFEEPPAPRKPKRRIPARANPWPKRKMQPRKIQRRMK